MNTTSTKKTIAAIQNELLNFKPNLEIEKRIEENRLDKGLYDEYALWLRSQGQHFLADYMNSPKTPFGSSDRSEILFGDRNSRLFNSAKFFKGFAISITWLVTKGVEDALTLFFKRPFSRFLTEFRCSIYLKFDQGEATLVTLLKQWPRVFCLKSLALENDNEEDGWSQSAPLGKLSDLWPKLPNLEFLYLKGSSSAIEDPEDLYFGEQTDIGIMDLPKLTKFKRRASDLTASELDLILHSQLPELTTLVLILGEDSELTADNFIPLFEGNLFPKLTSLSLERTKDTKSILDLLVKSPLYKRLTKLSLSGGDLTAEEVQVFFNQPELLINFENGYLNLSCCLIGDETANALEQLGSEAKPIRAGSQRASADEQYYQRLIYQEAYSYTTENDIDTFEYC